MNWYLIGAIFVVGLWGVIAIPNLVKKIVALSLMNSAIILFFVSFGSLSGDTAPILTGTEGTPVDPLPQALMLTAIVVGVCVVALALVLVAVLVCSSVAGSALAAIPDNRVTITDTTVSPGTPTAGAP